MNTAIVISEDDVVLRGEVIEAYVDFDMTSGTYSTEGTDRIVTLRIRLPDKSVGRIDLPEGEVMVVRR